MAKTNRYDYVAISDAQAGISPGPTGDASHMKMLLLCIAVGLVAIGAYLFTRT